MKRNLKYLFGAILTIIGSFLPWYHEGYLIPYWSPGIRISLTYPLIDDNGGLLIILLSLAILALLFRKPIRMKNVIQWMIGLSLALVFLSIYFVADFVIYRNEYGDVIGRPEISVGFIMVIIGVLMLMVFSIADYRKRAI